MKESDNVTLGWVRYASFLTILVICAFILVARLLYLYLADAQRFPIRTIKLTAAYCNLTSREWKTIIEPYLEDSFFSIAVSKLYSQLMRLDWTKSVQVERQWPDTLKIILIEKIPVATWNHRLLTAEGEIFNSPKLTQLERLPQLSGPKEQHQRVLEVYQNLSTVLLGYGLKAIALALRDNHAWELTLDSGVQLRLGKKDLNKRILRFCKAYPAVFAKNISQLISVDLRYPKGMAVQWKNNQEQNG